jgi:hypothetical protein
VNIEMQRCASCHGTRKWHDHFAAHGHECQTFVPTKAVAERARHAALVAAAQLVDEGWWADESDKNLVALRYASDLPARLNTLRAALDGEPR